MKIDISYSRCFACLVAGLMAVMPVVSQTATPSPSKADSEYAAVNPKMIRNAGLMTVNLGIDLTDTKISANHADLFVPVIVNGQHSQALAPVGVYGRTRYYQYLRSGEKPLGGDSETSYRNSQRPDVIEYSQTIPYENWMDGSHLELHRYTYGCCRTLLSLTATSPIATYKNIEFVPQFRYLRPEADSVKMRELSGRAYIEFPVNRTELHPDYRRNAVELAKVIATIDSVRNDKDVTVQSITIKGYASPEGTYANNERLAKGRTGTLKEYVETLYNFPKDFISTAYEPEDWDSLRAYVAKSSLANRDGILAIIDGNLAPDPKEAKIKADYPDDYKFLLSNVYPGLRHSDYTIEYTIRTYSDVNEIREVMATAPQKLSLNEMFLLAQSLKPGSDEYNSVFETAVRMYPADPTANLNAANSAMSRKDYASAARYLDKAGSGYHVTYARGVLKALQGDYADAERLMQQAENEGMRDIKNVIRNVSELRAQGK